MLRSNAHCIALEYEEKHVLMDKSCGCISNVLCGAFIYDDEKIGV